VAGCTPLPDGVTKEMMSTYDAAVASIGCDVITERHYLPLELQTGFSREQLIEMGRYRISKDAGLPIAGGGMRLYSGACEL
jgi:hypothetical protein